MRPRSSDAPALPGGRPFALYLIAAGLADAGFWVAAVAQGWLVVRLTDSPLWLGLVASAAELPALVVALWGGVLADRFDRRRVIAALNAGTCLVALVTALLVGEGRIGVVALAGLALLSGAFLALEHPVDRAFVFDLARGPADADAGVERAIALSSAEFALARTVGPALGGIAIAALGVAAGWWLDALLVVPAIVFALVAARRGLGAARAGEGDAEASVAEGVAHLGRQPGLVTVCLLVAAFTIGVSPYLALLAAVARDLFHLGERGYGALQAAGGVGALGGSLALALLREPRRKLGVLALAVAAGGALVAAFALARSVALAAPLLVALGAVDAVVYALGNTYVQEAVEPAYRGRANALFTVAFLGGIPVGNALLGAVAARAGIAATLATSGALVAVTALAARFAVPAARRG